jgi:protein SCO1
VSRRLLIAGPLALLAASLAAVQMNRQSARPAQPAYTLARLEGTDVWPSGMRPAPAFALRDQTGRFITRSGLRGHVWAVTFLDSKCRQACPVAAHALANVQRQLGPRYPLKIVIVSVLPRYDNPSTVRAFARHAGLSGDWHWLLGTRRQLVPVWQAYGIWVRTGIEHTAALYLVDRRGDVRIADGVPFIPSQLAASVRALSTRPGRRASSSNV